MQSRAAATSTSGAAAAALTISGMTGTMEVLRGKATREQRGLRGGVTDLGFSVDWIGLDGRQARLLAFRSGGEQGCAFGMGRGRSERVEPRTIRRGEDERKKQKVLEHLQELLYNLS